MIETSRNGHANIDSNRLPPVFRAVLDYIAMTGINPGLLYDLEIYPFDTIIALSPVRILPRRRQQPAGSTLTQCSGAFREYIKWYRPKLVGRATADGREAPRHLFLMDDGAPITIEALQSAMVRAMSRQRLPEITTLKSPARCKWSSTRMKPTATLFAHANTPVGQLREPGRQPRYGRKRFSVTDLIKCANTNQPGDI